LLFSQEKLVVLVHLLVVLIRDESLNLVEGYLDIVFLCLGVVLDCLLVISVDALDQPWVDQERVRDLFEELLEKGLAFRRSLRLTQS